jgi:RHH-type transcriptional regulator, rel operon repressor / antitoxin RelB
MSTTMTVRLEDDVKDRLDALAEATQRSKSFLAAEAIRVYVENNEWQIGEIQAALKEADAGDFASDKDVTALAKNSALVWQASAWTVCRRTGLIPAVQFSLHCRRSGAGHLDRREYGQAYLPNTVFSRSVVRATGSVRIFFSSSPTMWNRPSSDLLVT